jgi:uncharacterized protein YdaT
LLGAYAPQAKDKIVNSERNDTMSKKNRDQHVVPHEDGWAVRTPGSSRVGSVHDTQVEAIQAAIDRAKDAGSEVLVHGRDGKIRARDTYGKDPFPPRG